MDLKEAKEIKKIRKAVPLGGLEDSIVLESTKLRALVGLFAKAVIKQLQNKKIIKKVIKFPEKQTVDGEVSVRNFPKIFKIVGEVFSKVKFPEIQKVAGDVTAKVVNFPLIQKITGKVKAEVDFPEVQKVKVLNQVKKMYIEGKTEVVNLPIGKADKKGNPEDFINIRFTDGKRYYDLKEFIIAGGGFPSEERGRVFIDPDGKKSPGLVDREHHVQADILSVKEVVPVHSSKNNPSFAYNWSSGELQYIEQTISGVTFRTTFTWSSGELTASTVWVEQ